jgi:cytochrome c biogenesis protein CcmG/thiol:disulfide interchange protein DsbE
MMKSVNFQLYGLTAVRATLLFMAVGIIACGCEKKEDAVSEKRDSSVEVDPKAAGEPTIAKGGSPVEGKRPKELWARSILWEEAPEFVVEKWLTDEPSLKGKFLLIEFWATWCGPCKRTVPKLNSIHEKFGDKMIVIGVSDEPEEDIMKFAEGKIEYYLAMDTQKRMKSELRVLGIPHVIIVEPGGYVIWEGFPLLEDYELTEERIEKILEIGKDDIS